MALPPRFTSRVNTSTVQQSQRRIQSRKVADGVGLLARTGAQAVELNERADQQVQASQHRVELAEARRDYQAEVMRQSARLTDVEAEASKAIAELERAPEMFGEGHSAKVAEVLAEARSGYIEGLPRNEQIRQRATQQWDAWAARAGVRAETFEAARRAKDQGAAWDQTGQQTSAMLFDDPTPEHFAALMQQDAAMLEGMDIAEGDKEALYNVRGRERAMTLLSGMLDRGQYDEVDALRKSPVMKPFLAAADSMKFRDLAANGRKMLKREGELAEEAARDAVRTQIDNVEELIKQGVTDLDIPLPALIQQARLADLDAAEITKLEGAAIGLEVNRRYTQTGELTSHIRQLETKQRAGDLDQVGQRQLFYMRERLEGLSKERATEFEEGWDAGGKARGQAVAGLMSLPLAERVSVARQLDTSGDLGYAVQLHNAAAQAVVRGAEIRKADKTLLPSNATQTSRYRAHFDQAVGGALATLDRASYVAMFEMSLDVLADHMDRRGLDTYNREAFTSAVNIVLGFQTDPALGRKGGGLGSWNDSPVWLPTRSTQASFEAELSGQRFEGASEPADVILRKYVPIAVDENMIGHKRYQFVDNTGALLGRSDGNEPYSIWLGS